MALAAASRHRQECLCYLECTQFDAEGAREVAAGGCDSYNGRSALGVKRMSVERSAKLKPQHAPKAPHEDPKFLESTPARPLRILAEYINPLARLKTEGIGDTIVMFGSARIHSREDTLARLEHLKRTKAGASGVAKARHREALVAAKNALEMSRYYEEARAPAFVRFRCS